jgi:hypothetical protein
LISCLTTKTVLSKIIAQHAHTNFQMSGSDVEAS